MVISKNMEGLVAGSLVIRRLFEEGLTMAKAVGPSNVYDFSLGNPASEVPQAVKDAIADVLENSSDSYAHGYMKNAGFEETREAVALHLNKCFNMGYTAENIIMTVGAAGAMNCVFRALLEPEDEVIAFAPFFGEYRSYTSNYGGKLVVVTADTENFDLSILHDLF